MGIEPTALFEGLRWKPAVFSKGELIIELKKMDSRDGADAASD